MDRNALVTILNRAPHIELPQILRPRDIVDAVLSRQDHFNPREKKKVKDLINSAIVLASSAHMGVLRKSGEPYITHPYSVAYLLASMGMDHECIIAGLLHDTVEDTTTTLDEISAIFGNKVAQLVDGVTKLTHLNIGKEEKQAHAFKKLITFAADDIRVIFIKLLDRLHNMMTLESMREDKQKRISDETLRFYAPLAHRMGIYWLKEELEALSFFYLMPENWRSIDNFLTQKYKDPNAVLHQLKEKVLDSVTLNSPRVSNKIHKIYGRIKSFYSIYRKTAKKNHSYSSLHDIIGIRVVIDSENIDDCYLVMAAIHSFPEFTVMNERFKDYISMPKPNGYMSIHTGVRYKGYFMEIQIRTIGMHRIAEEGNASHWAYKEDADQKDKTIQWLQSVLSDVTESGGVLGFMKDIETALPLEKISIFTPRGDLITLPEGATVLDFAYAIHGDLGNTCLGATVNGKLVPIYYKLKNKDEVEIDASKRQVPRSDWLNFVVTQKAKNYIRRYLKKREKSIYIAKAKEKLKPLFETVNRANDFERIEELEGFRHIADLYSLPKKRRLEIFFLKVSTGEIKLRKVIKRFFSEEEIEKLIQRYPHRVASLFPEKRKKGKEEETEPGRYSVYIEGIGEIKDYHVAKCCNPEQGDPIVCYLSPTRGYIIHNVNCPSLESVEQERIVKNVYWYSYNMYLIEFIVEIKNTKGALLEIIREITESEVDINSLHINPQDTMEKSGIVYVTVKGSDIRMIDRLRTNLKQNKDIISLVIGNITDI